MFLYVVNGTEIVPQDIAILKQFSNASKYSHSWRTKLRQTEDSDIVYYGQSP